MNNYEAFLRIIANGSISKTAEELGYSQSSVSHMLQTLEQEMDCTLVTRDRNGVKLTSEGEQLLPYINDICNAQTNLKDKVAQMHNLTTGKIRIGTFSSVSNQWLPSLIRSFHEKYPEVEFELMHGTYNDIETWLGNGSADCGFLRIPTSTPMKSYPLKTDAFLAIVPENHPMAKRSSVSLQELSQEDFIYLDDKNDHDIDPFFHKAGYVPDIRYTAPDVYSVMSMVKIGLGVSVLADLTTEHYDHIVKVPLDIKAERKLGIALAAKPSYAAKEFVKHVRRWIKDAYGDKS